MLSRSVTVPPEREYPFYIMAKCYTVVTTGDVDSPDALTLLLLHSTSFHKEIYEPTLDELASLVIRATSTGRDGNHVVVKEAWAVECPNHGESAVLNRGLLKQPCYEEYFGCERYAEAVFHFLNARDVDGQPYINCKPQRFVGIGHSLGGVAIISLSTVVQFASLVVVDPFLFPGRLEDLNILRNRLVRSAHERRDVFPTREAARGFLAKKGWDKRVLDLYVNHAIREHPAWNYPRTPYKGYSLACTREQEATMYRDADGATKPIMNLDIICAKIPVHIIFGDKSDVIPRYVQDNLVRTGSICRFASVTWIPEVGHLIPQHAPKPLARVIYTALAQNSRWQRHSKL